MVIRTHGPIKTSYQVPEEKAPPAKTSTPSTGTGTSAAAAPAPKKTSEGRRIIKRYEDV